jgi:hypothetical protein
MDIELVLRFVDAIYRADVDTARILRIDAGLSDDVGHETVSPFPFL